MRKFSILLAGLTAFASVFSCESPEPEPGIIEPEEEEVPDVNPPVSEEEEEEPVSPEVGKIIYQDNLDNYTYSSAVYLDQSNGSYINATGEAAANVSYSGLSVSIRNSYESKGYPEASGKNAFNFGKADISLNVENIGFKTGWENLEFSFGVTPPSGETFIAGETIKLYVFFDSDASNRTELSFTAKKYGSWYLATSTFGIAGGVPTSINFVLTANASNIKVDDLKLTVVKDVSQTVTFSGKENHPWPETPEVITVKTQYKYITHKSKTVVTGQDVRNYSACYDTERHNPVWVAYPCHPIYREGGYARTTPDPWRPDPKMELSEQSKIFGSDWAGWPWTSSSSASTDKYQYWVPLSDGEFFTRGHLLRSADRGGNGAELNIQTFYPTNIAPERMLYPDIHGQLEELLSGSWTCTDTTYVVAGCWYDSEHIWTTMDASNSNETTSDSKLCIVPTHQFKIYLRTKSGNTGKSIYDCSADELMAIGFWLPQRPAGEAEISGGNLAYFAKSVDEIEALTGNEFNFFPEVPASVTASCNLSDWISE